MPDTWGLARTAEGLFVHGEIDLATADRFEEQALEAVLGTPGPAC
jgi:anti-anti-sigma regulatory factor